jgi:transportin-3
MTVMAGKESGVPQALSPVLAAVATMQGNVPRNEKIHAHEFLENFQKSVQFLRSSQL